MQTQDTCNQFNYCKNFIKLDNKSKFVWLMTTEDIFLVENLGHFLIQSFKLRSKKIFDGQGSS